MRAVSEFAERGDSHMSPLSDHKDIHQMTTLDILYDVSLGDTRFMFGTFLA